MTVPKLSLKALAIALQVPHRQEVPLVEWKYIQTREALKQYGKPQVFAEYLVEWQQLLGWA